MTRCVIIAYHGIQVAGMYLQLDTNKTNGLVITSVQFLDRRATEEVGGDKRLVKLELNLLAKLMVLTRAGRSYCHC